MWHYLVEPNTLSEVKFMKKCNLSKKMFCLLVVLSESRSIFNTLSNERGLQAGKWWERVKKRMLFLLILSLLQGSQSVNVNFHPSSHHNILAIKRLNNGHIGKRDFFLFSDSVKYLKIFQTSAVVSFTK